MKLVLRWCVAVALTAVAPLHAKEVVNQKDKEAVVSVPAEASASPPSHDLSGTREDSNRTSPPSTEPQGPNWFWTGFWPNLASTFFGIFLGLPAALWVNRMAQSSTIRREEKQDREKTRGALNVLTKALQHNVRALDRLRQVRTSALTPGIDLVAWDAVKHQISVSVNDPDLHHEIATLFVALADLKHMHDELAATYSVAASALRGIAIEQTQTQLRDFMRNRCSELIIIIQQMIPRLQAASPVEPQSLSLLQRLELEIQRLSQFGTR